MSDEDPCIRGFSKNTGPGEGEFGGKAGHDQAGRIIAMGDDGSSA